MFVNSDLKIPFSCNRQTPECIDIGFSSNIDIGRTHIEVSSKRGVISMKVAKHPLYTAGRYLLPKYTLSPCTFPQATTAILKSYLFQSRRLLFKMTRGYENTPGKPRSAFLELRGTVKYIWSNVTTNPEVGETSPIVCGLMRLRPSDLLCFKIQLAHGAF